MLKFKPVKRKPILMHSIELTDEVHAFVMGRVFIPANDRQLPTTVAGGHITINEYRLEAIMENGEKYFLVQTLEDDVLHRAEIGDYLLMGIKGELWNIKPEVYKEIYEEI